MVARLAARIAGLASFGGATLVFGVYGIWMIQEGPHVEEVGALWVMFGIGAVIVALIAAAATSPFIGTLPPLRRLLVSAPFAGITALVLVWLAGLLIAAGRGAGVLAAAGALAGIASYAVLLADASARRHAHA